jgi:phospholipid/cholesterol/gamma-HCH transport system substrate-binding protein
MSGATETTGALVKIIIFVVVTLLATSVLAATIANIRLGGTVEYKAVISDVTGMLGGDDVRIAGVRVGEVGDIRIKNRTTAEVTLSVDADRKLARSTRAVVRYRNLIGQRYVALMEAPGDPTPMKDGDTIPLAQTQPALDLTVLFNGFKPLFAALSPADVNKFADEIVKTLQGEAGTVESLLARTASLTSALADRDKLIGDTIDNLNALLATLGERDEQLSDLIIQLQRFMSGLAGDRKAIGDSLANINALTTSTADLLKDARAPLRGDIRELGEVAKTLDDHRDLVEHFITFLPEKMNRINRTASYGSWFNFYLCTFEAEIVLLNGEVLKPPPVESGDERCTA